jgi:hypothetical protein
MRCDRITLAVVRVLEILLNNMIIQDPFYELADVLGNIVNQIETMSQACHAQVEKMAKMGCELDAGPPPHGQSRHHKR